MIFGNIINQHRTAKGWSAEQLISQCNFAASASYIHRIERQYIIPSTHFIIKLSKALEIDLNILLDAAKKDKLKEFLKRLDIKYKLPA